MGKTVVLMDTLVERRDRETSFSMIGSQSTPERLLPHEMEELERCENEIARGIDAFYRVGEALKTIQEQRLYRGQHLTFAEYCQARWGIGRQYAYRLIGAASVMAQLAPSFSGLALPSNEAQTRYLMGLPSPRLVSAWQQAIESAKGERITAAHVKAAVEQIVSEDIQNSEEGSTKKNQPYMDVYSLSALRTIRKLAKAVRNQRKDLSLQLLESLRLIFDRWLIDEDELRKAGAIKNGRSKISQSERGCVEDHPQNIGD